MNKPTKIITHTAVSSRTHTVYDVIDWHSERWPNFKSKMKHSGWGPVVRDWNEPDRPAEPGELLVYRVPESPCGYHFVHHFYDGSIYQTRALNETGAHCIGQNNASISSCSMGNGDKHPPSPKQIYGHNALFARLQEEFPDITIYDQYPHRKYANKTCHGSLLPDDYWIDRLKEQRMDSDVDAELEAVERRAFLTKKLELLRIIFGLLSQKVTGKRMSLHEPRVYD